MPQVKGVEKMGEIGGPNPSTMLGKGKVKGRSQEGVKGAIWGLRGTIGKKGGRAHSAKKDLRRGNQKKKIQ